MTFDETLFKMIRQHRSGLDYSELKLPENPTPEQVEAITEQYELARGYKPY